MKPAWDQLGSEYETSSSVVIADVDCTVETDLCSDYDVKGYPTIKYFTSETDPKGTDYSGGRTCEPPRHPAPPSQSPHLPQAFPSPSLPRPLSPRAAPPPHPAAASTT